MKLVRYQGEQGPLLGVVAGGSIVTLAQHLPQLPREMPALIESWPRARPAIEEVLAGASPDLALADAHLLAPVARPGKIMAIGLNFADHIAETGLERPERPLWFTKAVTSVAGPFDAIELPRVSASLDYEAELVAVIGRRCRHVEVAEAAGAIFGYCAGNDVTVRDWQRHSSQWCVGKSFDTHAPIGPWIVTADEIGDPHALDVRCLVNGELRQHSNTRHLVFDIFDQIAYLSAAMTLEPGDLVFTGTPGGVGAAMQPPRWLVAGDLVRVEIEAVGAIEGVVTPEPV
jgi:2-keto-4-pentenoate hydratase/2-oxohepta-3-ene-1,7-dioic acid hydratase in catechol pathway